MEVVIVKDLHEACQKVYEVFEKQLNQKKDSVLGLATGSSPIDLYAMLCASSLDFSKVVTFNLDEYFGLDKAHPQSYRYFMDHHLFDHINISKENIHIPSGIGDIQKVCDDYNELLKQYPIDLQLLGMGSNGHVGFNEPGTPFDSVTHYIALKQSTIEDNARLFFNGNIDEVPKNAITMGISNILSAKKIVLIACGPKKHKAIQRLLNGEISEDLPVSALVSHPDFTLYLDEAAYYGK